MLYLKVNEKIRELMDLVKDSFKLGCKDYCKYKLIALDEFELLRKELEYKNLKKISDEEYKELIKSTESVYFHNTHVCFDPNSSKAPTVESDGVPDEEEILREFQKDKIREINKKRPYFEAKMPDHDEFEYIRKMQEESDPSKSKSELAKMRTESSLTYALSMVGSLLLLALGGYYLGKYFLGMSDSNTYKLVLVITIVVMLSEMILLILKLNRETEKKLQTNKKLRENSFAYKFNKKYRDQFIPEMKKVYPGKDKAKFE